MIGKYYSPFIPKWLEHTQPYSSPNVHIYVGRRLPNRYDQFRPVLVKSDRKEAWERDIRNHWPYDQAYQQGSILESAYKQIPKQLF